MRDILIAALVLAASLSALRRPWIGILAWTLFSLMSPHRYAYGFALSAPVTMIIAVCTLTGFCFTAERRSPFMSAPPVMLLLLTLWITLSWLAGYDTAMHTDAWLTVFKINFMVLVTIALLRTKFQINAFVVVCVLSLGLLGAKGGLFTLASGGNYRVWGPPGTFVDGNNEFALALVTIIPLIRYVQMQMVSKWQSRLASLVMLLCAAAALGSHSRGALVALGVMALMLWWRGSRNRFTGALVLVVVVGSAYLFLPAEWFSRMETIETFQEDRSALGRFSAWSMAWNSAFVNPTGFGMGANHPEWFEQYSKYGLEFGTPVAHSIYFQMLGLHGFVGLFLFLAFWASTWLAASALRREAKGIPEAAWCADLGSMIHVAIAGFLVGGAFLSLAYYDLPYDIMAMVVVTRSWLRSKAWLAEPPTAPLGWGMWRRPKPVSE
jgi:putative inorganic carbon (HCO3(-)) transporter